MGEAFRLGGWGMYPTAIVGAILVLSAGLYAWQPERRRLAPIVALGVLTMFVSSLGFVAGVIRSMISSGDLPPGDAVGRVIVGVGESLNNIGFGLCLLVIGTGAVAGGLARRKRATGGNAELISPTL